MHQRMIATGGGILVIVALLYVQWPTILDWAVQAQRDFQNAMARGLRATRSGEPWAIFALCAATCAYGFVHALGPGHGKILLGGASIATEATLRRMITLSFASALAQSGTAIVLVLALVEGARLLSGSGAVDMVERWLMPLSYLLIAGLGGVLFLRGFRLLIDHRRQQTTTTSCGHAHGPTATDVARARSWYDHVALIATIAVRPCSGALFLLIIAARLDLIWVGILGTLTMGLGTALLNAGVASSGVLARRAIQAGNSTSLLAVSGLLHVVAGGGVILLSAAVLVRLL